jgi:hypothetical protein
MCTRFHLRPVVQAPLLIEFVTVGLKKTYEG